MKVLIIKWANVDFFYEKLINDMVGHVDTAHIRHNPDRLKGNSNLIKDTLYLVKEFASVIKKVKKYDKVVIFGSNIARVLPYFIKNKKISLIVFNEIDGKKSWLNILDKMLFFFYWKSVAFSSYERAEIYSKRYNKNFEKVLLNLPLIDYFQEVDITIKKKEVVYCGVINKQRFSDDTIADIVESGYIFNFVGKSVNVDFPENSNIYYLGEFSHEKVNGFQKSFFYALLSYPVTDLNNDYCAPIKIYEYINNGCVCVSVYRNKGLEFYFKEYPQLFVHINDLSSYEYDEERYQVQRNLFLSRSICALEKLVGDIL